MKYLFYALLIVLVVLSLAAGGAKFASMPQEMEFFADAGVDPGWLMPLGTLQIIAGLLAIFRRARRAGIALVAIGFLVSTAIIFMTGNIGFGIFSLLPVLLCAPVFWLSNRF